jgi:hypothetical protein
MAYYHDLVTQKSWQELKKLGRKLDFVLIGGWAVYLYTRALKSKDIDIVINYDQLELLGKDYDLSKNDRLNKYEAVKGEVQIDIYLPHYSKIGIPVEVLLEKHMVLEGFKVIEIEYLLVLKLITLEQRGRSPKGRKDFIDSVSLLKFGNLNLEKVRRIIKKYKLESVLKLWREFLGENFEVEELKINKHEYARLKKNLLSDLLQL